MMRAVAVPHLIDSGDIEDYPLSGSDRLNSHYFTMFMHDRWLNSDLYLSASIEVQGYALNLYFLSQKQSPIGTLPNSDEMLARLLRIDLSTWRDLRQRTVGPLHKWRKCRCGDEIRLMHPVVTEVVMEAFNRRDVREASNAEKAVYQRMRRLRDALSGMGCSKAVLGDDRLIERMDEWMLEHCKGPRRGSSYERALDHAGKQGWFGGR